MKTVHIYKQDAEEQISVTIYAIKQL